MTLRFIPMLATAVLFATPTLAQSAKTEPSKVQAGAYEVEPNHTQIVFGVSHFGFTTYYGQFRETSGTLTLDPAKPADSKLDVAVKIGSVSVQSPKLEGELKSDAWLDAGKFPEATFKSTKVTKTGASAATVVGDLTLHGVTKPVTLEVTYVNAGPNPLNKAYTAGFEAKGKIKRTDFGVKTYAPAIGDEVDLMISGTFVHQS